jgi:hypothetical protein
VTSQEPSIENHVARKRRRFQQRASNRRLDGAQSRGRGVDTRMSPADGCLIRQEIFQPMAATSSNQSLRGKHG